MVLFYKIFFVNFKTIYKKMNNVFYLNFLFNVNELLLKTDHKVMPKISLINLNNCKYFFNDNFLIIKNYPCLF